MNQEGRGMEFRVSVIWILDLWSGRQVTIWDWTWNLEPVTTLKSTDSLDPSQFIIRSTSIILSPVVATLRYVRKNVLVRKLAIHSARQCCDVMTSVPRRPRYSKQPRGTSDFVCPLTCFHPSFRTVFPKRGDFRSKIHQCWVIMVLLQRFAEHNQ